MPLRISRILFPLLLLPGVALGSLLTACAALDSAMAVGRDERLRTKITVRRPDTTLRELLEEIGKATGTKLTPPEELAEQKFTLFFKERPAAQVMAVLADYLDRKWSRNGDGYELFADRAAQAREAEHADAPRALMFAKLDQALTLGRLPQAEVERLYRPRVGTPDRAKLSPRELEATGLWLGRPAVFRGEPGPPAMGQVWRSLTPADVERLKSGGTIRWNNRDGSMPSEVATALVRENRVGPLDPRREETAELSLLMTLATGREEDYTPGIPPVMDLHVETRKSFSDGRGFTGSHRTHVEEPERSRAPLPAPDPHDSLDQPFSDPSPEWRSRFTGLSDALRARAAEIEKPWRDEPPLSALLELLHDGANLDICSDSFVRVRTPAEARPNRAASPGAPTLRQYLDQLGHGLDYAWTLRDGALWFRSSFYYLDRPREPPPGLIAELRTELGRQPERQLELLAEASLTLTPDQIRGLADHWPWHMAGGRFWIPVPRERPGPREDPLWRVKYEPGGNPGLWKCFPGMLALYASLTPPARAALKSGKGVQLPRSTRALDQVQQDLVRMNSMRNEPTQGGVGPQAILRAEVEEREYIAYEYGMSGRKQVAVRDFPVGERPELDPSGKPRRIVGPPMGLTKTRMLIEAPGATPPEIVMLGFFRLYKPVARTEPPAAAGE